MNLARMRTCGGGGTRETAVGVPGRDGGRPLVGRASEFRPPSLWDSFASSLWGKNGCARYSNRREREGRTALGTPSASWCYSCSVARFESESGDLAIVRNEINSRSCDEKRIYIKF